MEAALGSSKDYSLKQYLLFVDRIQCKSKVGEISFYFIILYVSLFVYCMVRTLI